MADPLTEYLITAHAAFEMQRRGIDAAVLRRVRAEPEQRDAVRPGREVFQSRIAFEGRTYLVRVLVDVDRKPAEVVTVYRTSKIEKYWSAEP
jgi:hypothetical protein